MPCATDNNDGQSRGNPKSGNHHWLVTSAEAPLAPRPFDWSQLPTMRGAEAASGRLLRPTLCIPHLPRPPQPRICPSSSIDRSTLFSSIPSIQSTRGRCCQLDQPHKGRHPPASQPPVLPVLLSLPEHLPTPVLSPTVVAPWHSQASFPFWSA